MIDALSAAVDEFVTFHSIEPDEGEFRGLELMFGANCVKNGVTDGDLEELINEASSSTH